MIILILKSLIVFAIYLAIGVFTSLPFVRAYPKVPFRSFIWFWPIFLLIWLVRETLNLICDGIEAVLKFIDDNP